MSLALSTLTLDEFAFLSLAEFGVLVIDPHHTFNEGTIYEVVNIQNISRQLVPISVQEVVGSESPFFEPFGQIRLYPSMQFTVEEYRIDLAELEAIARKGLITYRRFQQLVGHTTTSGTSGSGE